MRTVETVFTVLSAVCVYVGFAFLILRSVSKDRKKTFGRLFLIFELAAIVFLFCFGFFRNF